MCAGASAVFSPATALTISSSSLPSLQPPRTRPEPDGARFPPAAGDFRVRSGSARASYTFSPGLQLSLLGQYDNLSHQLGVSFRLTVDRPARQRGLLHRQPGLRHVARPLPPDAERPLDESRLDVPVLKCRIGHRDQAWSLDNTARRSQSLRRAPPAETLRAAPRRPLGAGNRALQPRGGGPAGRIGRLRGGGGLRGRWLPPGGGRILQAVGRGLEGAGPRAVGLRLSAVPAIGRASGPRRRG